jgi:hypothetical protein
MRRNTSAAAAAFFVTAAAGLAQEPDARTFRPGAMAERTAEASGYCGQRGAALVGVDHLSSPEGAFYRARFVCGAPAGSGIPVTYGAGDFGRIKSDLEGYCRERKASGVAFTTEPALSGDVLRGKFRCE